MLPRVVREVDIERDAPNALAPDARLVDAGLLVGRISGMLNMIDIYTKGVLTVIAIALCLLVAQNAASIQAPLLRPQKVQICDDHTCLMLTPLRRQASTGDR